MNILDHAFFLIVAIVFPVVGFVSFRRLVRRIASGANVRPSELYRTTALVQWILFVGLAGWWLVEARSFASLGFSFDANGRLLAGIALTVIVVAMLVRHLRPLDDPGEAELAALDRELGDLKIIFPRSRGELAGYYGMSITAGIVEETLWRGFLFWYLGHVMPLWAAAIVSAVGFGLAHAYQGIANVPRIIGVGSVFALLYLITGSLWLSILLHALVDMLQGRAVFGALQRQRLGTVEA